MDPLVSWPAHAEVPAARVHVYNGTFVARASILFASSVRVFAIHTCIPVSYLLLLFVSGICIRDQDACKPVRCA